MTLTPSKIRKARTLIRRRRRLAAECAAAAEAVRERWPLAAAVLDREAEHAQERRR